MPLYDVQCPAGHVREDVLTRYGVYPACQTCGEATTPLLRQRAAVRDDTFLGGQTFHNLADRPVTFSSKTAYRDYLQRHGIAEAVRHVPVPGSDKSPHTERWGGIAQETLDGATAMLTRMGLESASKTSYLVSISVETSEEPAVVRGL